MLKPFVSSFVCLLLVACASSKEAVRAAAAAPPVQLPPAVVERLTLSAPDDSWALVAGPSEDNRLVVFRLALKPRHAYVEIQAVRFTAGSPVEAAMISATGLQSRGMPVTEWQAAADGTRASFRTGVTKNGHKITIRMAVRRVEGAADALFYVVGTWPDEEDNDLIMPFFGAIVDGLSIAR